jgi:antiviral helicase SLH1
LPKSFTSPDVNDDLEKDFRNSITDVFITGQKLPVSTPEHLIGRLSSKPKEVLEHIYGIMSTTLPDDVISGELADLVGFDDIEIVAESLASRSYFVNALSGRDRSIFESSTSEKAKTGTVAASLAPQDVRRRMEETLRANASRPLFTGVAKLQKCFHMCTLRPL